jgi:hypothetical protein
VPIARPDSRGYRAVARIVRPLMFSMIRYDWRGGENFPRSGGFIAAANHVTEFDALTLAHYLFDQGFEPRILAKRGLFTAPLVGSVLRATRMIPVEGGGGGGAAAGGGRAGPPRAGPRGGGPTPRGGPPPRRGGRRRRPAAARSKRTTPAAALGVSPTAR